MKAIVYTQYGAPEVLQLKEVEKPMPKDNEILVRVRATAVNSGDLRLRKADPFAVRLIFGLTKPNRNILGSVFSGEVESVGKYVTRFKVGDKVFGHTDMKFGAYAEYMTIAEDASVVLKPEGVSYTEAAGIPFGAVTAWHFIRQAGIKPGQKVLINGASGAVGSAAIQLAKHLGAEVTGVCSASNVELVKSLGADHVIDYSKEDPFASGKTYDVIMDTVNKLLFSASVKALNQNGILMLSAAEMPEMIKGMWTSRTSSKKVLMGVISHSAEVMEFLKKLVESGEFKPVIDKTFSMSEMAQAHTYVEQGHKKGNVAVSIA